MSHQNFDNQFWRPVFSSFSIYQLTFTSKVFSHYLITYFSLQCALPVDWIMAPPSIALPLSEKACAVQPRSFLVHYSFLLLVSFAVLGCNCMPLCTYSLEPACWSRQPLSAWNIYFLKVRDHLSLESMTPCQKYIIACFTKGTLAHGY